MEDHSLIIFTKNEIGVLNKISALVRKKRYNIESITAFKSESPKITRITLNVSRLEKERIEQITRQLSKIVEVIKVIDVTNTPAVRRELALIKLNTVNNSRSEITLIADVFRGNIIDLSPNSMIVEVYGNQQKIESAIKALAPFSILEIARTGITAMER